MLSNEPFIKKELTASVRIDIFTPDTSKHVNKYIIKNVTGDKMNRQSLEEVIKRIGELGNECIKNIMMPISSVAALEINESRESIRKKIKRSKRTFYPVYNTGRENFVGIIHIKDLLISALSGPECDLMEGMHEPVYFKEDTTVHQVYDIMFQSNTGAAFIVNKGNNISGFITLRDITKSFLGSLQLEDDMIESYYTRQQDGSWLVDGQMPVCSFKKVFNIETLPNEEAQAFKNIGGFLINFLGKVPSAAEGIEFSGYSFKVIEVNGSLIEKIIIKKAGEK